MLPNPGGDLWVRILFWSGTPPRKDAIMLPLPAGKEAISVPVRSNTRAAARNGPSFISSRSRLPPRCRSADPDPAAPAPSATDAAWPTRSDRRHIQRPFQAQRRRAVFAKGMPFSLGALLIPRFCCQRCRSTCSRLPLCLAPRRQYWWRTQQGVFEMLLAGASIREVARRLRQSRRTVGRRWQWLVAGVDVHALP